MLQAKENLMKSIQTFLKKFGCISSRERPMALLLAHERFSKIKQAFIEEEHQQEIIQELLRKLLNDLQILNEILLERGEHAAQIKNSSNAIAPEQPDNSLSMRDEHLDTISETESDEVIKSSVEDLVSIPSESEDTSESDSKSVVPLCDDFSPINIFEEKSVTFTNPLFNSNDDLASSDDESLSDEGVLEDNRTSSARIHMIPTLTLSDVNEDEYFTPGDDVELLLHRDPSTPIMSVVSILEGFTDEPPLKENDDLFDLGSKENEWKKILYDAQINDSTTEDKVFDLGIHDHFFSPTYVSLPFDDHHYIFLTYVVRIFLPHFTYIVDSPFLLSSRTEDTIFDPGISAFHFSHRNGTLISFNFHPNILNESPMDIFSSTCFAPNITMIWEIPYGEIKEKRGKDPRDEKDGSNIQGTRLKRGSVSRARREYLENSSNAVTSEEPDNSLSIEDEHLDTILETESDKVIKSSVEDLIPIPSESKDTSKSDSECVLLLCDDFSPINVFEEKSEVSGDNVKTYSNPLFKFNDEYISGDVNPFFDEVLEDIECKDSYDSNLDESTFLVTPLSDVNKGEYFTPGDDVELLLHRDPSTPIMSVVFILKGFTDEPPLEENGD
uniref:Uncharacterized protein n=1 Tax=Tanacetum cinerariifolium TaxID=118510 RepID=A0A699HDX7_TANCI|nr:hypothetical protein [Tanacetum cinerariifolium]